MKEYDYEYLGENRKKGARTITSSMGMTINNGETLFDLLKNRCC
ncbi:MAG: hypothetical protein ACFFD4_35380 [Candidatus Odinarchaeota archaeon]